MRETKVRMQLTLFDENVIILIEQMRMNVSEIFIHCGKIQKHVYLMYVTKIIAALIAYHLFGL